MVEKTEMTNRKKDHLDLASKAQVKHQSFLKNDGICYEPLLASHKIDKVNYRFLNFDFKMPFWISSMTGGEESAYEVNSDLARACESLGFGMGLGSCRVYIEDRKRRDDFHIREFMPNSCLAANLGIAQLEQYLEQDKWAEVEKLLDQIKADFLFIHINPLQEWLQPEGDRYLQSPLITIKKLKKIYKGRLGIKEVGQGFGPKSLKALVELGVDVIELAGSGGTNFTKLERMRSHEADTQSDFEKIGHHWSEMLPWLNKIYKDCQDHGVSVFPQVIVSGGVASAVEAAKISIIADFPHLIGMGYTFLNWQRLGEKELKNKIINFYNDYQFALNILDKE